MSKPAAPDATSAYMAVTEEKREQIYRLRMRGLTYAQISKEVGLNETTCHYHVAKIMTERKRLNDELLERMVILEVDRLDSMLEGLYQQAFDKSGKHVLPPAMIDRALAIMDRRARLLGLEAPTKNETTHIFTEMEAAQQRLKAKRDAIVERPEG
jgi:AcrR family transcriptional regulator